MTNRRSRRVDGRVVPIGVRPLNAATVVGLIGSGIVASGLFAIGGYQLVAGKLPTLFALMLTMTGAITAVLTYGASRRHRKSWAFLIGTWMVFGFCAFFTAPKVIHLPRVQPAWKLPKHADGLDPNTIVKLKVLAACLGFVAPFGLAGGSLAIGRRDFERTA